FYRCLAGTSKFVFSLCISISYCNYWGCIKYNLLSTKERTENEEREIMNSKEAYTFYQKQYEMFKDGIDLSTLDIKAAEQIMEQAGGAFHSVLELGAGNGQLARSLATFEKDITTIELVRELVEFAREFQTENVTSFCGSFYDIELPKTFDLILYMDGFGVGTDDDQLRLLKRIHNWLAEDGTALIDIYQPYYWKRVIGQKMAPFPDANITRVYRHTEQSQ